MKKGRIVMTAVSAALTLLLVHPAQAQSKLKSFDITTDTTFGALIDDLVPQAHSALDQSLKQKCYPKASVGPYNAQFKSRYRCGEIPYGTILNDKKKRVLQVKVPRGRTLIRLKSNFTEAKKGEPAVGAVTMRTNFEFSVMLDRAQYTSRVTTSLLDQKKSTSLQVKSTLGDTITVRHRPQGGALYSLVCGYLPGLRLESKSSDVNLDASYTWRVWFFSATERLTALNKIKNGSLSTSSGKVCGVVKTSIVRNSKGETLPKVELLDVSYPTLTGLKVKGPGVASTRVVIHTLGLKIANFVLKLIGRASVEKMVAGFIQDTVKQEVNRAIQLHVNDIKTGKFFETTIKEVLKKNPTSDILKAYSRAIKEAVEVDEISIRNDLVQQCRALVSDFLKTNRLPYNASFLTKTCGGLKMDVSLLPFASNSTYAQRGCYSYPHSPVSYSASGKSTWWRNSCGLTSRIRITAEERYIDVIQCLSSAKTQKQQTGCVLVLLEDLFGIPEEILNYLNQIDSVADLKRIAQQLGFSARDISEIERNFLRVIRL